MLSCNRIDIRIKIIIRIQWTYTNMLVATFKYFVYVQQTVRTGQGKKYIGLIFEQTISTYYI